MMETQSAHPPPTRYKTVRRANPHTNAGTTAPTPSIPIPIPHAQQQQQATSPNDALARSRSRYRRRPTIDTAVPPVPIPTAPVPALPRDLQHDNHSALASSPNPNLLSPIEGRLPRNILSTSPAVVDRLGYPQSPVAQTPTNIGINGIIGQTERKINVQVGKETLAVPVLIDTEASTLAAAVSKLLPGKTILNASILLESFKGLGLERPVRKYERIRDIMNGWEDDTKNTLILIPSLSGGDGLNAADAPLESPPESYEWISYMVKPGKWSKRWFMMRDGAILMSKKETKKDKELQHVFNLSDFDVYDPTPNTASNVLKCPKRYCFAVKSQQKASLFQNTSDWVHYFATNDKNIYTTWLNLLRTWRSYYLVRVKGYGRPLMSKEKTSSEDDDSMGKKKNSDDDKPLARTRTRSRPPTSDSNGRKKFTPLISEAELAMPPPLKIDTSVQRSKSLKGTAKSHGLTSTSPTAPDLPDTEVFAPTGLLGRTYTKKVKEMQEAEKEQRRQQFPLFTPASAMANLANGLPARTLTMSHKRASSAESALNFEPKIYADANSSGLSRQKSLSKQKPKPLLDFSDNEQPPLPHTSGLSRQKSLSKQKPKPLLDFSDNEQPPLPHTSGLSRHKSLSKQKPKPLLDFSDSEQPPLPRSRYRARTLVSTNVASGGGGLISGATGPASYDAPPLPNSALWNTSKSRPGTRDKDYGNQQFMHNLQGNPFTGTGLLAHPHEGLGGFNAGYSLQGNPFTGTGLLAQSHEGVGAVSVGHGVYRKGGDGTLLDIRNKSVFQEGSLLARVEKERPDVPLIDRGQDSDST